MKHNNNNKKNHALKPRWCVPHCLVLFVQIIMCTCFHCFILTLQPVNDITIVLADKHLSPVRPACGVC